MQRRRMARPARPSRLGQRRRIAASGVLDAFGRADAASLGANWTASSGAISNGKATLGSGTWARWDGTTLTADHSSEIDVEGSMASAIAGVTCRYTDDNNFYIFRADGISATDEYQIYKRVGSSYTKLTGYFEDFPAPPFRMKLEVHGTKLLASIKLPGGNWRKMLYAVDAALATGKPGFFNQGSGASYDNFDAANLLVAPVPLGIEYVDDFNRANSDNVGPNWAETNTTAGAISSNALTSSGSTVLIFWNTNLGTPDHFIEVVTSADAGTTGWTIGMRQNIIDAVTAAGYDIFTDSASGGRLFIRRLPANVYLTNGTPTNIFSGGTSIGKTIRIEVQGTAVRFYVNGVLIYSGTDANITAGNYVRIRFDNGSNAVTSFKCGPL